jgi:hypothetical integral membrane protein (TIGR02206 family)
VRLFGPNHLACLSGIAALAAVLAVCCRRRWLPGLPTRIILAGALAAGEFARLPSDGLHFPDRLPLQLCNVATWCCVLACLTLTPLAVEFAYFAGVAGASVALLTPDMGSVWPPQFFFNHGGIVIAASALVYGKLARLRPGAMWRAYGLFALYGFTVGTFNGIFQTNYAYLRAKPGGWTLMTPMGPWPVYILWAGTFALALFWLLWLPVQPVAAEASTKYEAMERAPTTAV